MLAAWKDVPDESPDAASPEDVPPAIDSTPGTAASPDEETFAVTGDIAPAAPAEESRRAVPPDATRTQPPAQDGGRTAEPEQTADAQVRSSSRAGALALDSSPVFATGSAGNLILRVSSRGYSMNVDQFLAEVKNLADLGNDEEAEKATRATLETLRERLAGNEPSNLAAQLPPEIASFVEGSGGQDSFDLAEFYSRVAQKEGVGQDEAAKHARAVAAVLQTAVTGGELDHVRSQLGNEYKELFGQPGASA